MCDGELQIYMRPSYSSKNKEELNLGESLHALCRRAAKLVQSLLIL